MRTWRSNIAAAVGLGFLTFGALTSAFAVDLPEFPDPDTDKPCGSANESPECAAKTFWLCSEKSVATCKLAGLDVQPDGTQHKEDGTLAGDAWMKPWTMSWTELLNVTNAGYMVWEIKGFHEVTPGRLRGSAWNRRALTGTHEMIFSMMTPNGAEEKESVFFTQKKGLWIVTGYAKWRGDEMINACEKRKLGSLACRYTITGLSPWQTTTPP